MKNILWILLMFLCRDSFSQGNKNYTAALNIYRAKYTATHDVIQEDNKKYFNFFSVDPAFAIKADFTEMKEKKEVKFETFNGWSQRYLLFGKLIFTYKRKRYSLLVYFSPEESLEEKYKNHLFIPFTDQTNGISTYGGGRYVDILTTDINMGKVLLDFNKSYNPYCAYTTGYSCPRPPIENALPISILAGEKNFGRSAH